MGKYRSRLQIIADVLSVTIHGTRKVQIMFKANLSYALLCRYLADVMEAGLVCCEENPNLYRITQKGRNFLERFREYSERYNELKDQLNDVDNERMALKNMVKGGKKFEN